MTATRDQDQARALARAVELVSAAYVEAMREHGLLAGTALVIRTAAESKLAEVLDADDPPADAGP
ncbi:hypothetical protein [Actinomadura hibisca]|uniref:hypothetical protein n=1 Tax=Actinomadura hibisca TaxID=68565 RepID=UPI000832D706|nr:hypothetical protein [Actinomadura hibisca]